MSKSKASLVNFKLTSKKCKWPGCKKHAVIACNPIDKVGPTRIHCLKHYLRMKSGRVGVNWKRDFYREHLKPICALTGVTWHDQYHLVKMMAKKLRKKMTKYELVRRTCQSFDVDHINGNHSDNRVSNLQTLTKIAHKFKTDVCGDAAPAYTRR